MAYVTEHRPGGRSRAARPVLRSVLLSYFFFFLPFFLSFFLLFLSFFLLKGRSSFRGRDAIVGRSYPSTRVVHSSAGGASSW